MFGAGQAHQDGVSVTGSTATPSAGLSATTQAPLACFHIEEIVHGDLLESHRTYEVHEIRSIRQNHKEELPMQQHSRDCMTELLNNVKKKKRTSGRIPGSTVGSGTTIARGRRGRQNASSSSSTLLTGGKRFVIKHIRKECMESQHLFEEAASALENEANMMKGLCHPCIPRLRGMSLGGTEAYYCTGRHNAFFLVTERIEEYLQDRIVRWRTRDAWFRWRNLRGVIKRNRSERLFVAERLMVALDIAEGLQYMHEHGICHRSLDSTGIGFTPSNQVQILRLGKARKQSLSSRQSHPSVAPNNNNNNNNSSSNNISPVAAKQLKSKRLSPLLSSTKAPTFSSLSQLILQEGSARSSDANSSSDSNEQQHQSSNALTVSSNGFEDDVLGFSKILCEILTMRSFGGDAGDSVTTGRRGKACMRDFRSLATKIPRSVLELLQRGLSDLAESRPTMKEFCICLCDVHFDLSQGVMNATTGKGPTNANADGSPNTTTQSGAPLYQFRHRHGQSTRRGTQLGLCCEGSGSEEFKLFVSEHEETDGYGDTELVTEYDGATWTTMCHQGTDDDDDRQQQQQQKDG